MKALLLTVFFLLAIASITHADPVATPPQPTPKPYPCKPGTAYQCGRCVPFWEDPGNC